MGVLDLVPAPLKKFVDPTAPVAMRTMAAKGLVPIPPKDLVLVQCVLAESDDKTVAEAADKSLRSHPDAILKPIVQADMPGEILDVLATRVSDKPSLLEALVLNRAVMDDTLARVLPSLPENIVSILFQNEERILRSQPLVIALKSHTLASRASIDRMFDLLVRSGVIFEGIAEYTDALLRLTNDERLAAVANIEVPTDLLDPSFHPQASPELLDLEAVPDEEQPVDEVHLPEPLLKRLQNMSMAQKVAIALKGNKEVRTALLRDTNKMVAVAAIKNPRITENEVVGVCLSRSANEEVIRIVSVNREWIRSYGIKLALVQNPKTPLAVAMRFLSLLNQVDLKNIAKSKNLPSAIANQAKAMMSRTSK
jgi:hypothetical protein